MPSLFSEIQYFLLGEVRQLEHAVNLVASVVNTGLCTFSKWILVAVVSENKLAPIEILKIAGSFISSSQIITIYLNLCYFP